MRTHRSFLLLLTVVWSLGAYAQSFYYSGGEKISLLEDRSTLVLHFEGAVPASIEEYKSEGLLEIEIHPAKNRALLHFSQDLASIPTPDEIGIPRVILRSVQFGMELQDGFPLALTHRVVLQWQPDEELDQAQLDAFSREAGVSKAYTEYQTVVLEVENPSKGLVLANQLYESGMVLWAHPDFYAKPTKYQDPLFSQQFQMNNTGQSIDGFSGQNDIDVDAPEAWGITTGSSSLVVAVIDDGLEAHEDLVTAGGASRVLGGYTPANNGNGTPNSSGAHGMSCAGIIAASHNGIGVQGLAPNVNLRSVNIFWGGESTQDLANGVTWAKNQGADVLSNSWGYTSCTASFDNLNNAIADAASTGRGGLGCVIIFASGNGYKSCVDYPADLPTVMAVGAVTNQGNHSDYANTGPTLDIVAPSNAVSPQPGAGVRTVDRMGSPGYSSGNYALGFGGTSAACPAVAGVAALVLSANPGLTKAQVDNILTSTADDMGSTGYDTVYGAGRVNAFAAVQAAGGSTGGGGCSATVSSFPYTEGFEGGLGAWSQASGDDLDWVRRSGSTPSGNTGPTSATQGSFYLHVESSSPNYPSKTAILNGPCFDLSGLSNPEIAFDYHMWGADMGILRLQASTDGSSWSNVWSLSGDQGNSWQSASASLSAYAGSSEVRLRWSGTTANGYRGDMSIDDIAISNASTGGGCTGTEVSLNITLDNYPAETTWSIVNSGGTTVASGGSYSTVGGSVAETICLQDGCYDFIINDSYGDGICCAFGNGSYSLTDGATVLASGGNFTTSETTNFCLGGGTTTSCPSINFGSYSINAYGNGQDQGSSQVQDGGATLLIQNNAWKSISYNYTVTANTVLQVEFRSTTQGEIHGIAFDNDNAISSNRTFKFHGTQNWGLTNYDNYSGTGWVTYAIPVGSFYTGTFNRLCFVGDHDGGAQNGNAYFRNVKVYESGDCTAVAAATTFDIVPQLGTEEEVVSWSLYPNPSNGLVRVSNVDVDKVQSALVLNLQGQIVARFTAGQLNAGLDLSAFKSGTYFLQLASFDGSLSAQRFSLVK